ncbi:MAG TPA: error-prone DNA polymerase, partial [Chloroflexota bacterium]|nr:error-prone DNA polymerase [Chloroflexota bacterium]
YARGLGMLCQARGSSVGSMVCYCLEISAVEPLAHHLSFERFLALGRADPPDIDLDLPSDRGDGRPAREAMIQYALTKYADHAALVSTQITFRARSAIREVGMALGLDRDTLDALAGEQEGFARARSIRMAPNGPVAALVTDLCAQLDGIPRHLGQHPGGIIVTRRPLAEVAPIEHARMLNRRVIQWDKDAAEGAGLAKIDLLGLGMLAVIENSFARLAEQTGRHLELHGFRCDDPAVFDAFCAADTVGVFQLESRAQMNACLPRLQPRTLADLAIAVALIRPGPLQANATNPYLRRRQGAEVVTYPGGPAGRRLLEPILGDTLGVCIFQDQVLETGRACGLSPDEAAALRRAISSARSSERLAALRLRMEEGLRAQGIDETGRTEILAMVQAFSGYGFVRGHSVAFGYLAYVSCWLKVYHPA